MFDVTIFLRWVATYWLHSTLLLGSTWIWFRYFRPSSHTLSESAWKLASVGAFLTTSLQLSLGVESPLNAALNVAWSEPAANRLASVTASGPSLSSAQGGIVSELFSQATGLSIPAWVLRSQVVFRSIVPAVFFILATGLVALTLLGVVRLIVSQLGFLRRMQACRAVESGEARDILDRLLQTSEIRRKVTLLLASEEIEPGAWGMLGWRIVLPPRALEDLSATELQALLAHELAHLARGDQWWIWIGHVLTACVAWQPLNRIAFREWRKSAEYLCDAWAVERNVSRLNLARCLASVAEWRMSAVVPLAGVTGENRSSLSGRVERLVDDVPLSDPWRTPGRRQILLAAASFFVVAVVCCAPSATFFSSTVASSTVSAVKPTNVAVANSLPDVAVANSWKSDGQTSAASGQRRDFRLAALADNDRPQAALIPSGPSDTATDEPDTKLLQARSVNGEFPQRKLTRVIVHRVSVHDVMVDLEALTHDLMDLEEMLIQSRTLADAPHVQVELTHFQVRLYGLVESRELPAGQGQLEL